MQIDIKGCTLELARGDISTQVVDAIVNAANSRLAGGGGVDHAIHSRGGPAIMDETNRRYPNGCPTGSAVASGPGQLPCKVLLHAVGPVWRDGESGEPALLRGAYHRSLELALEHSCDSVALPALSTGAYGYPMELAADETLTTIIRFLEENGSPSLARVVLFHAEDLATFESVLTRINLG